MRDFITCLEFLTRIRFSNRTDWHDDDFSRSVPYFPFVGLVMGLFMGAVNYGLWYLHTPDFMRAVNRTDWHDDDFSRSVPYFPFVGLVMGLFMGAVNYGLWYLHTPDFMRAVMLILAELLIIGALMYDGFMDTSDGVFSARNRERMLEIMKDSHVGSNAVIALVCLVLLKVAAYSVIPPLKLSIALVAMYVCTRTFMVSYIINYKYARKNGIGHMFKAYAKPYYTYIAFVVCLALVAACGLTFMVSYIINYKYARKNGIGHMFKAYAKPYYTYIAFVVCLALVAACGLPYLYTAIAAFVLCQGIAQFLSRQLGGLTGDTYGFLTECGVVIYLMCAVYIIR